MSKQAYTVFEAVGFTEPIPGLRRRPVLARGAAVVTPIVERVDVGEPHWAATQPPAASAPAVRAAATRGRAAPLATGAVLLAMAGAGWATLQASSPAPLDMPQLPVLATVAPPPTEPSEAVALSEPDPAPAQVAAVEPRGPASVKTSPAPAAAPVAKPVAKPADKPAPQLAVLQPTAGDLLRSLPPPAAGQAVTTPTDVLPPAPSAMPTSPLSVSVSPVEAAPSAAADAKLEAKLEAKRERQAESKVDSKADSKVEDKPAAAQPPQPPASSASS